MQNDKLIEALEPVEAMRQACIAAVRAEQKYEGSDFPVCNAIVHAIKQIPALSSRPDAGEVVSDPMASVDRENAAWDWLEKAFGTENDDPADRAYDASEMVEAFHAGYAHPPADAAAVAGEEAWVSLLTKALGDITAALSIAGKEHKIQEWTAPYVAAINEFDAHPAPAEPVGLREAVERFLADRDDGDRADAGTNPLMEAHIVDFRAALSTLTRTDEASTDGDDTPAIPSREQQAWDWLENRTAPEHPNDIAGYGVDDMVDAFIAGREVNSSFPAPAAP